MAYSLIMPLCGYSGHEMEGLPASSPSSSTVMQEALFNHHLTFLTNSSFLFPMEKSLHKTLINTNLPLLLFSPAAEEMIHFTTEYQLEYLIEEGLRQKDVTFL